MSRAARRPWEPDGPRCGTISHYNTGCGSDLCRAAARTARSRIRRKVPHRNTEPTVGQARRELFASLGMDA